MSDIMKTAALALAVVAPVSAMAAQSSLDGVYAYYQANTAAEMDRGPRNDADCRKFLASGLYKRDESEHLKIVGDRWDDNQDVSDVTGNVELGQGRGNVTPFTINVESEAADGTGDGITPAKGTVTRNGKLAISITIEGGQGRRMLHYCKVD
ncbi:hypothetical protein EXN61_26860 [Agrobacterium tumefaciens]|uniref:Adhesin n=1 Tax=Agrobacterium tumefaciens TaxID=358 RepID=A0A546XDX8_AGRTU|nr:MULTISPECIES: hypothetical protein [Agrobacterium]MDA5250266.1 hypothetical protein [Agrobacterium sp. MAFF210268]TRA98901.1 hypothetical protein EXN61_26860 [Agrobacterium tumefaciens]